MSSLYYLVPSLLFDLRNEPYVLALLGFCPVFCHASSATSVIVVFLISYDAD